MKVLCIGLAVMDISARAINQDEYWEEKQHISEIGIQMGGDAVNQGIFLEMLGMSPGLNICVGSDNTGRMLRSALEQKGVDISLVRVREGVPTGTALVIIDDKGERHVFSVSGAERFLRMEDLPDPVPEGVQAISLASLFGLDHLERDGLEEYLARARRRGILVFADAIHDKHGYGLKGIQHLFQQIDYFLPSSYEAEYLSGADTPGASAQFFRKMGVKNVIIKCGADGVYADCESFRGMVPAPQVEAIDTTGAGDCFVASFISGILRGYSVNEACHLACAAASYSTRFLGASTAPLSWEKVQKIRMDV